MPGSKQRTQNWKQRERNADAELEPESRDTEKSGLGARGGDASHIAGQSNLAFRLDDPAPPPDDIFTADTADTEED